MADEDKPPIMVPWINSPRLRRFEAWLWNRPKTAMALAAISFVLISSPVWFADFWSLFSNDAPVPVIMNWIWSLPPLTVSWYWLPVGLGAAMLTIILAVFWRERKRLEAENVGLKEELLQKALPVPTPISEAKEVHAECERKIARLLDSEHTHALRANSAEDRFKQFQAEYAVPLEIANHQLTSIGEFIEIVRACTHDVKLDDDLPTIRWGIRILNHSVFRIQLDGNVGPLFFEGRKLTQPKDLVEDTTLGLSPYREGSLIFEQQLSQPESELFKRRPDGLFQFDQVLLHFKGYNDARVKSARLIIPSEFRARLGRCSDIKSQGAEALKLEINHLKLQLTQAQSEVDDAKRAERKELIKDWRELVAVANRQYGGGNAYKFLELLEFQDGFMALLPHLSKQTWAKLFNTEAGRDNSEILQMIAQDIAKAEQEWGTLKLLK